MLFDLVERVYKSTLDIGEDTLPQIVYWSVLIKMLDWVDTRTIQISQPLVKQDTKVICDPNAILLTLKSMSKWVILSARNVQIRLSMLLE